MALKAVSFFCVSTVARSIQTNVDTSCLPPSFESSSSAETILSGDDDSSALVLLQKSAKSTSLKTRMASEEKTQRSQQVDPAVSNESLELLATSQEGSHNGSANLSSQSAKYWHNIREGIDLKRMPPRVAKAVLFEKMIEFELGSSETSEKNKIVLVIIEMLMLGMCGIDRCYAGQTCLGIIKGVTLGGLGIWTIFDYVTIMVDCLLRRSSLEYLGYNITFTSASVDLAYWIAFIGLIAIAFIAFIGCCVQKCCGGKNSRTANPA